MASPKKVQIEVEIPDIIDAVIASLKENETLVEVVRCGECKYLDKDECCSKNGFMIWDLGWFCADGERRADG